MASEIKVPDIQINFDQQTKSDSLSSGNGSDSDVDKSPCDSTFKHIPCPKKVLYDSASSNGEDDFELTDELRDKIIKQAEYYFSDENLKRDGFLLKHVKRNKEGFVNLKLLASFKKMRSLSRDYRAIGEALKASSKLSVNESGLKIRRLDPLPQELLDQARVKILVISNIPNEDPSMDYIIAAFPGQKDDVISVRIVKPGKKFPNDLQSHFSRHADLKDIIVAIVEFDSPDNATAALKNVDTENYEGIVVKLLELGPKQAKKMSNSGTASDTPTESDHGISSGRKAKKKGSNRLLQINGKEDSQSSCASSSDSEFSSFSSCSKRYNRAQGSQPSSPKSPDDINNNLKNKSPLASPLGSPKIYKKGNNFSDTSPVRKNIKLSPLIASDSPRSSPEMQRKTSNTKKESERSGKVSPWMLQRLQLTNNDNEILTQKHLEIIRQPKGPDGSFGFMSHPLKKYILVHAY